MPYLPNITPKLVYKVKSKIGNDSLVNFTAFSAKSHKDNNTDKRIT